jgi:hypothetical protein
MKEKPLPLGAGVYKRHRKALKQISKLLKVSEGEALRQAISVFSVNTLS